MIKGIDISHWQGIIDWDKIPIEYKFVFMKASEGSGFIDNKFSLNWFESKGELLRGAYHFWRYAFDPDEQAQHFYDTVSSTGDLGELPPVVDIEDTRAPKGGDISVKVNEMLTRTSELFGKKPIVYTAKWYWNEWLASQAFGGYDLWVAHYRPTWLKPYLPAGWADWQIWQHSSKGSVPGIGGNCDLNVAKDAWYESYATQEPPAGRNITLIVPKGDKVDIKYV